MLGVLHDIYIFLLTLSVKLKLMSFETFCEFLKELDYQQKIYAIWLRFYF